MGVIFEEPTHNKKKKKTAVCIGRHLNSNRHGIELILSVFLFGGNVVAWDQKKSRSSDLSEPIEKYVLSLDLSLSYTKQGSFFQSQILLCLIRNTSMNTTERKATTKHRVCKWAMKVDQ